MNMLNTKVLPFLILSALVISSCSKNRDTPIDPPLTQPNVDPNYLIKTEKIYLISDNGYPSDTSWLKWVYDDKYRQTLFTSFYNSGNLVDTTFTTYKNGQGIQHYVQYVNKVKNSESLAIAFFNAKGLIDSTIYGLTMDPQSSQSNYEIIYFSYDANGHDTSTARYEVKAGVKTKTVTSRSVYVNNEITLDETFVNDIRTYAATFQNGNRTTATWWNSDGSFQTTQNYTYNDVLAGGYYLTQGFISKNLVATTQTISATPTDNHTSILTYTLDNMNRVATMRARSGFPITTVYEYTYN